MDQIGIIVGGMKKQIPSVRNAHRQSGCVKDRGPDFEPIDSRASIDVEENRTERFVSVDRPCRTG